MDDAKSAAYDWDAGAFASAWAARQCTSVVSTCCNWGLVLHFTKDLKVACKPINSRADTIASFGMFRGPLAQRRALAPVVGFYAWRTMADGKQLYAIARGDDVPIAMAWLWTGSPRKPHLNQFPARCA